MNGGAADARITRLEIREGGENSRVIDIDVEELIVGRRDDCGIVLSDRNISRRHARITRRDGRTFIADLCSFNGVFVNGERIGDPTVMSHGDVLHLGDYRLTAVGAGREVPPPPLDPVPLPPLFDVVATLAGTTPDCAAMALAAFTAYADSEDNPFALVIGR